MAEVLLKDIIDTVMLQAEDEDSYLYGVSRNLVISHAKRVLQELNYAGLRSVMLFMSEVGSSGKVYLPEDCVEYVRVFYCVGNYLLPAFLNEHINTTQWDAIKDVEERLILTMTGKRIVTETGKYLSVLSKTNEHVRDYGDVHGMCFLKGYKYNSKENNIVFDYVPCGVTHVAIEYVADPLISEGDVSRLSIHKYFEKAMEEGIYHRIVCKRRNVPMNEKLRAKKEWNIKYKDALNELNAKPEEYFQLLMGWRHMRKGCYPGMGGQVMGPSESEAEDFYICRYEGFVCQREEEEVVVRYEGEYWRYVCQTEEVEDVIEYGADYGDFVCQTEEVEEKDGVMKMTTVAANVSIRITGNRFIIDWGDGVSEEFTEGNPDGSKTYNHVYSDSSNSHEIAISGQGLTWLNCYQNQLTSLDVTDNPELANLYCNQNQLASLDLSKNPLLTTLICYQNQLINLDVTHTPELKRLNCYWNQLANLDVTHNPKLADLNCGRNQLTSLDVTHNPELKWLSCFDNQLVNIDLSKNSLLTDLGCSNNKLTSLDLSENPLLADLGCFVNQLANLDLSKNPLLTDLNCDSNQLTSLDLSENSLLTELGCNNNKLTSLDVTHTPELKRLSCFVNQLANLDVTHNPKLAYLNCGRNQLTSLDLSENPLLADLGCDSNQLTSLDVTDNPELKRLNLSKNPVISNSASFILTVNTLSDRTGKEAGTLIVGTKNIPDTVRDTCNRKNWKIYEI